jgi:hypothetical protein
VQRLLPQLPYEGDIRERHESYNVADSRGNRETPLPIQIPRGERPAGWLPPQVLDLISVTRRTSGTDSAGEPNESQTRLIRPAAFGTTAAGAIGS